MKKDSSEYILGFKVNTMPKETILNQLEEDLIGNKFNIVYNINPLIVMNFYKNFKIKREFNKYPYNIPDGIGIVLASKIHKGKILKRITGIELFLDICHIAEKNNKKVFLYGSKEGVAEKTKENIEKRYPNINIVGSLSGYMNEKEALKTIIKHRPDILFIGLGSPKQEKFIIDNIDALKGINIVMPIGGSMDVISGNLKGAPEFYKKVHLEWLYRLVKEPKRIKQDIRLIKFVLLVIFKNNWYNERAEEEI